MAEMFVVSWQGATAPTRPKRKGVTSGRSSLGGSSPSGPAPLFSVGSLDLWGARPGRFGPSGIPTSVAAVTVHPEEVEERAEQDEEEPQHLPPAEPQGREVEKGQNHRCGAHPCPRSLDHRATLLAGEVTCRALRRLNRHRGPQQERCPEKGERKPSGNRWVRLEGGHRDPRGFDRRTKSRRTGPAV